jgi:hypothetical protein
MRVPLVNAVVAATLLFQMHAHADPALAQWFNFAKAAVLVRVVESTFPATLTPDYELRSLDSLAKLLIIRSWKGPFPAELPLPPAHGSFAADSARRTHSKPDRNW